MAQDERVLIAGGGIAGLATALALARRGIRSHILEQREQFSEAGAGIQIGPNGVRVLEALGAAPRLTTHISLPEEIVVHQGGTGRVLTRLPLGNWIAERHGAPYWVVHRRDLQAALLACARETRGVTIEASFSVAEVKDQGDRVAVRAASGATARGSVLIGADGIRSRVRTALAPDARLRFSGKAASRALLSPEHGAALGDPASMGVWLAPGAHVVHYPISAGAQIAVIAIVPDDRMTDDWAAANDWATLEPHLAAFAPALRSALARAPEWRRWALFETDPLADLAKGRIALAGDAAHPVLPFLAQGGVMALEDAMVLADALAAEPDDPARALKAYEATRRARVDAIVATSRQNGRIFHLSGPAAIARNLAMAAVPATRLMARYDWVYSWRPPV
ncbi:MAG TPA: FAD-dependent monooxygenase [Hyphomicrobiaceae bacterium]|jgi:salicylate hydroxylase|nr:FAD-dependent monooxygenase [Hyphomicrobiaceae bacterium]